MATNTVKQHIPIFVSSTYKDLVLHRAEVERRLTGLEQIVKGMEYFGSSPETPLETCLKKLSECKLVILIVGVSYGSVIPDYNKSFTELEYEFALKNNIPVLVYIADLSSTTVGIPLDSVEQTYAKELEDFRNKLKKTHTVSFFSSIDDLGKKIEHDVPATLADLEYIKIKTASPLKDELNDDLLKFGAMKYEQFWLRPSKLSGEIVPLRLRINKRWSGWKVKDELISALGLEIGDTISTEVSIKLTNGIIDDDDDTDLFASSEGADWLLENATVPGSVIDCYVRFSYCKAPVGFHDKVVNKVSLIFVKGIKCVGTETFSLPQSNEYAKLFGELS